MKTYTQEQQRKQEELGKDLLQAIDRAIEHKRKDCLKRYTKLVRWAEKRYPAAGNHHERFIAIATKAENRYWKQIEELS